MSFWKGNQESNSGSLTQNNSFYELRSLNSSENTNSRVEKTRTNFFTKYKEAIAARLSQATFSANINSINSRLDPVVCNLNDCNLGIEFLKRELQIKWWFFDSKPFFLWVPVPEPIRKKKEKSQKIHRSFNRKM
jgi:hypothetical protein